MPTGNVISENIAVTHDKITEQSSRNLNIYKDMENKEHLLQETSIIMEENYMTIKCIKILLMF